MAADILAENAHLTYKCLSQADFDFLENFILYQTNQQEAFRKFEALASNHIDTLRKKTKAI